VATVGEADVVCALLGAHGIEAKAREAAGEAGGWQEILVPEADLEHARQLIEPSLER
jgi:type III secretory pathway lipoprotein EscJ